jgi:hypothetical protein
VTSIKEVDVTVKQERNEKQPLVAEVFFIIKGEAGRLAQRAGAVGLPEGEGTATFASSKQDKARYVDLGISERSGDRIEGWLVGPPIVNVSLALLPRRQAWRNSRVEGIRKFVCGS